MRTSQVLCLLLAVSTAAASPIDLWPFNNHSCKKFKQGDQSKAWSIRTYKKTNCGSELPHMDSKSNSVNNCYSVNSNVKSMVGVANEKYVLEWYKDENCKELDKSSKSGNYVIMKEGHLPKSFMVKVPRDQGPFPRYAFCGLGYSSKVPYKTQALFTNTVCDKVLEKCQSTKNKGFSCPSSKEFYEIEHIRPTDSTEYNSKRCKLINPTMQAWFDQYCQARQGYDCERQIYTWGDAKGGDLIDVECKGPRPNDETK